MRFQPLLSVLVVVTVLCTGAARAQTPSEAPDAATLVNRAIAEMGGLERLSALRSMEWTGMSHQFDLVQSERPTGPWLTNYTQVRELRDLQHDAARRHEEVRGLLAGSAWSPRDYLYCDGILYVEGPRGLFPMPPAFASLIVYEQRLAPIRVLQDAHASGSLRYAGVAWLDDVRHQAVVFTTATDSVVVYLNADTGLPTAVDTFHPAYFDTWGTVRHRTYFSVWFLEDNGIRYPRQIDESMDGIPSRSLTIDGLTFDVPVPPDTMSVPPEARAMANTPSFDIRTTPYAQARAGRGPSTLPDGLVEVPGSWDVMFVRQLDGVVIIEAPISSEYSQKVIEDVGLRFPGLPIKGVVTTSDAWPHFAGLREYAARGIPIYALGRNREIIMRLFGATFTQRPDTFERAPRTPIIHWIDDLTVLGEGPNAMHLLPALGEGSERMLFVHFPNLRLLYASDMVQHERDGSFFMPQYLSEVNDAIRRRNLAVDNVIAMHSGLTPLSDIRAAIPR